MRLNQKFKISAIRGSGIFSDSERNGVNILTLPICRICKKTSVRTLGQRGSHILALLFGSPRPPPAWPPFQTTFPSPMPHSVCSTFSQRSTGSTLILHRKQATVLASPVFLGSFLPEVCAELPCQLSIRMYPDREKSRIFPRCCRKRPCEIDGIFLMPLFGRDDE